MMAASASLLNVPVVVLEVGPQAPAKQIVAPIAPHLAHIDGSFSNPEKIREIADKVDVLTVEIEHVGVDVLEEVRRTYGVEVHPTPETIRIIQDKFRQKEHLASCDVPVAPFREVIAKTGGIADAASNLGLPLMLKSKTLAYDGRGNFALRDLSQVQDALDFLGERPLYAEKWVSFEKEIAVMVVRTVGEEIYSYPVVETVHKNNICHLVFAPLRNRDAYISVRAQEIAERAVKSLSGAGVYGVEMFLLEDGASPSRTHRNQRALP
jgi:phosphoribosylaminoimidazole carboxylase